MVNEVASEGTRTAPRVHVGGERGVNALSMEAREGWPIYSNVYSVSVNLRESESDHPNDRSESDTRG